MGAVFLLLVVIAALAPDEPEPSDDTSAGEDQSSFTGGAGGDPDPMDSPDPTSDPTSSPEPEPEPEPEGFGNGIWRVGTDIEPGLYRAPASSNCYWARLSGFSGEFDDIEANEVGGFPMIVEILATDEGFESRNCARWIPLESWLNQTAQDRPYSTIDEGYVVVGDEMEAGQWRTQGGGNCYWARLSGFTGDFDEIESNGLPDGPAIVEIQPSDVGFVSKGCGAWERVG